MCKLTQVGRRPKKGSSLNPPSLSLSLSMTGILQSKIHSSIPKILEGIVCVLRCNSEEKKIGCAVAVAVCVRERERERKIGEGTRSFYMYENATPLPARDNFF